MQVVSNFLFPRRRLARIGDHLSRLRSQWYSRIDYYQNRQGRKMKARANQVKKGEKLALMDVIASDACTLADLEPIKKDDVIPADIESPTTLQILRGLEETAPKARFAAPTAVHKEVWGRATFDSSSALAQFHPNTTIKASLSVAEPRLSDIDLENVPMPQEMETEKPKTDCGKRCSCACCQPVLNILCCR
jgi:hypothetical protein